MKNVVEVKGLRLVIMYQFAAYFGTVGYFWHGLGKDEAGQLWDIKIMQEDGVVMKPISPSLYDLSNVRYDDDWRTKFLEIYERSKVYARN